MTKRSDGRSWKRDRYAVQAKESKYRSRAVYKLQEIDKRDRLFKKGQIVVDLGAAPGSWSQYASQRIGASGRLISMDRLPIEKIANVSSVQGDLTDEKMLRQVVKMLGSIRADLVISDIAPNLTGNRSIDQPRIIELIKLVSHYAYRLLKPGGDLLVKLFEGEDVSEYRAGLMRHFTKLYTRKPLASRSNSREYYILAREYKV